MGIVYYPNRTYPKKFPHAIDRASSQRTIKTASGSGILESNVATTWTISAEDDWKINNISLTFSNSNPHTYSVSLQHGRAVVADINDALWVHHQNTNPQSITLSAGFYTGQQLATEFQTQLDANNAHSTASITFVVAYNNSAGEFTITPNSGTVRYLQENAATTHPTRDSIAGHLFGLNVDTAFAASFTSDTTVFELDAEGADIIYQQDSITTAHYHDTEHTANVDQALRISGNVSGSAVAMTYAVSYEEIF